MTEQVGEPVGDGHRKLDTPVDRLVADEPVTVDVAPADLLPARAR